MTHQRTTVLIGDMVAWLEYPECVVSVLTPDPSEYPLDVHTIEIFFASQYGTLDNIGTNVVLSIQDVGLGEMPTQPGRGLGMRRCSL